MFAPLLPVMAFSSALQVPFILAVPVSRFQVVA
jgi:hypothetical protein